MTQKEDVVLLKDIKATQARIDTIEGEVDDLKEQVKERRSVLKQLQSELRLLCKGERGLPFTEKIDASEALPPLDPPEAPEAKGDRFRGGAKRGRGRRAKAGG